VSYTVVLILEDETETNTNTWLPLGEITAAARTQRGTVLRRLLEGQTRDGEGGDVPQIPIHAGGRGELLLIPTLELGDVVPVAAREQLVFEVVS
jgi:hypothetical protein